ncbi:hypothetical protein Goklo_021975, partial [Gossypium klotzschianum]|nr:hypothetical protein [Gossypium klotzschianum]
VDVDAATATEINEDGNNSEKLRPRSENSEDPQDSIGPFGQALRAAAQSILALSRAWETKPSPGGQYLRLLGDQVGCLANDTLKTSPEGADPPQQF